MASFNHALRRQPLTFREFYPGVLTWTGFASAIAVLLTTLVIAQSVAKSDAEQHNQLSTQNARLMSTMQPPAHSASTAAIKFRRNQATRLLEVTHSGLLGISRPARGELEQAARLGTPLHLNVSHLGSGRYFASQLWWALLAPWLFLWNTYLIQYAQKARKQYMYIADLPWNRAMWPWVFTALTFFPVGWYFWAVSAVGLAQRRNRMERMDLYRRSC